MIKHILHLARIVHSVIRESLTKPATRSDRWPTVRKHFLEKNPKCAACGGTTLLQCHHCLPFNDDPSKELDPSNLITLCMGTTEEHHLSIGHGSDFHHFSETVREDAAQLLVHPEQFQEIADKSKANRKPNQPGVV